MSRSATVTLRQNPSIKDVDVYTQKNHHMSNKKVPVSKEMKSEVNVCLCEIKSTHQSIENSIKHTDKRFFCGQRRKLFQF